MKVPLYAQICGWFLLNLALVGFLIYGFVRGQFHLGLDSLLAGRAGDRIEAVAGVIIAELRDRPEAEWSGIMERFSVNYGVRFALFRSAAEQAAGEPLTLPPQVRAEMGELGPRPGPQPPRLRPPDDEPRRDPGGRPPPPAGPPIHPKRLVRTGDPARYWVLMRVPINPPPPARPRPPFTLVAVSASLSAGGLFFEWKPWVVAAAGCLAVSGLCWIPFTRGLTVAIRRLTQATGRIAEGRFDARVPENRGDELGSLAGSGNRMASRLEGYVTGQKRFLGDIAHELCAPLARLQMALGILEQRAEADLQEQVGDLREEIEQMSALVGELLSFSKASLAGNTISRTATSLRAVIDQAVERERAPRADFVIAAPEGASVLADPDLLLRALSNLLRNAARYAGAAGPITVSARREGEHWEVRVSDRGPGVPAESLAKIFDPFYRVDTSRDRATGGVGLGLAIVKTCVEACGGTVSCRRLAPGFEVTMTLKAAA